MARLGEGTIRTFGERLDCMRDDRKVPLVNSRNKEIYMAKLIKITEAKVYGALKHNTREMPHPPSNEEIDSGRTHLNYRLDKHGQTAKEAMGYYRERMNELYHYERADVKTCIQWVCTAPPDLPKDQEAAFFNETYRYLNSIYGEENCIQCTVHYDEGVHIKDPITGKARVDVGRPHLHYVAIPVVENSKYGVPNSRGNFTKMSQYKEKVCCDEKVTLHSLQSFHPEYQEWIDSAGINATVYKGGQGISLSVEQLKAVTKETGVIVTDLINEIDALQDKVKSLENGIEKAEDVWGRNKEADVWGRDYKGDRTWNR